MTTTTCKICDGLETLTTSSQDTVRHGEPCKCGEEAKARVRELEEVESRSQAERNNLLDDIKRLKSHGLGLYVKGVISESLCKELFHDPRNASIVDEDGSRVTFHQRAMEEF